MESVKDNDIKSERLTLLFFFSSSANTVCDGILKATAPAAAVASYKHVNVSRTVAKISRLDTCRFLQDWGEHEGEGFLEQRG